MSDQFQTLLEENSIISLRTAIVLDDGDLVYFKLLPYSSETSIPGTTNHLKADATCLYRHAEFIFKQTRANRARSHVRQDVKPMTFEQSLELKLLWADSGHSVALFLNGEPWAFIHEEKNYGYSKGILRPTVGNPWDQELFEKTFLRAQS
jgi:hypothetical protein